MTSETDRRTRPITVGCVVLLVVVLLLAGAAFLMSVAVRGFFDRPAQPDHEVVDKGAGLTRYRLQGAVRDGVLTEKEIAYAAGGARWGSARDASAVRITVAYPTSGDGESCYRFTLARPLTDRPLADPVRLARCPADLGGPAT
ncbi:hypothetical protein [Streptomyces tauricus]|uniref:hypothetical protein n=1 Tax=Streptomyces tauricus TaxID=68274 RepID=UPI002242DCFB|nr:hypothetical protein [Streptomyces tauricus]MCW8100799.1 hypothetical protein [Streptomyces tauricus]